MHFINTDTIITFITGGVAGFFLQKILEKGNKRVADIIENKKLKMNLTKVERILDEDLNIVTLGQGFPSYDLGEGLNIEVCGKSLYIDFPQNKKHLITEKYRTFHKDRSFDGTSSFEDLVHETKIINLIELIEKHRQIVADDFINRRNGCHFNGEKFGVYYFDGFRRYGEVEKSDLHISLFTTDYFTHKVFKSIYKELIGINHHISQIKDYNGVMQYRSFATSFGVNAIVKVQSRFSKDSIIFTKRSPYATGTNGKTWLSISMIEGLSQVDVDTFSNTISLKLCLQRGLEEELGILATNNYYDDNDIKFYDLFLERNNFELGITALVNIKDEYTFEESIQNRYAKDKVLEVAEMIPIALNKKEIEKFVKDNIQEFYPQALYTLNSICMRKNLMLDIKYNKQKHD